jgi:hypothetical protein
MYRDFAAMQERRRRAERLVAAGKCSLGRSPVNSAVNTPGSALSITHNSGLPVSVLTEQIRSQARYFSEGTAGH